MLILGIHAVILTVGVLSGYVGYNIGKITERRRNKS